MVCRRGDRAVKRLKPAGCIGSVRAWVAVGTPLDGHSSRRPGRMGSPSPDALVAVTTPNP